MSVICMPVPSHCLRLRIGGYYCFFAQHYFSHVQLASDIVQAERQQFELLRWSPITGLQRAEPVDTTSYFACTHSDSGPALQCDAFVIVPATQLPSWSALHARQRQAINDYLFAVAIVDHHLALLCDWKTMLQCWQTENSADLSA